MYDFDKHRRDVSSRHHRLFELLRTRDIRPNRLAAEDTPEREDLSERKADRPKLGASNADPESLRQFVSAAIASLRRG
ncbi:hypothetical protein OB2597_03499 [Pseudooceanicola batsensis HTCC2597]|uniref:Uncharacterized protein n=1 Tax=Pseudooceanicola batsensis (strain ATCC BAA-863 / DSM 15984 / KCTC 12145 / HTCC2597) TaxID=252305 RepID=A3U424_PSEBH|nr:hypothetical protein [Pseudooceanicola batsensis]EAQ01071.1 hypothetical protein OB2597_03499 [Pseudooceanicola batsensis HTCC2597]